MEIDAIISQLLRNRGLVTTEEIDRFLHPVPADQLTLRDLGISSSFTDQAIFLIKEHMEKGSKIAVYGDYDVDGICSTAILWETLYAGYKNVFPHIPHRESEGYGLSQKGIDHCLSRGAKLIITVDNGIVAHKQIEYCRSLGCDIIIIDHHEPGSTLPVPNVLIHSTSTCAAGLAWLFSRAYLQTNHLPTNHMPTNQLELVAIAVICDIVPLVGINRSFAKYGLEELNRTRRPGLLALFEEAGLSAISHQPLAISPYHVGFVIGPRLNAMGRLEHAIDSLRLLCTPNPDQARQLASVLGSTNRARQDMTQAAVDHALASIQVQYGAKLPKILVVHDSSYPPGIIGLVAAKLAEKYYRPAIAVSVGENFSKASARSVSGFHITEHLRAASSLLAEVGGHAMAAGFTVETPKLEDLKKLLLETAESGMDESILVRKINYEMEIPLTAISHELYARLQGLQPFGLGNPQPVFKSTGVKISNLRPVGQSGRHLKLLASNFDAIYFNAPDDWTGLPVFPVTITYQIDLNTFNGRSSLQLVIKSINA